MSTSTHVFCTKCGMQNQSDSRFCSNCGTALTINGAANTNTTQHKNPRKQRGCLVLICVLLLLGFFRAVTNPSSDAASTSVVQAPTDTVVSSVTPEETGVVLSTESQETSTVDTPTASLPPATAEGKVTKTANLRPLPSSADGTGVIGRLHANTTVTLEGRTAASDWYLVRTRRGLYGWVSASLLSIDPAIVANVPVVADTEKSVAEWHHGGGVAVIVWNVEQHQALSSFQRASAGNTYLLVGVSIGTIDRDSAPYNLLYFSLKDDDGFEYSPEIYTGKRALKSGELPRGEIVSGYVAFEIPEGATGLTLSYQPIVILGGYELIRIPISE